MEQRRPKGPISRFLNRRSTLGRHERKRLLSLDCSVFTAEPSDSEICESRHQGLMDLSHAPSSFSRATNYLRRPPSPVFDFEDSFHHPFRVGDVFSTDLNQCSPRNLPKLREERAVSAPIICTEESDDDIGRQVGMVLNSRYEQDHILGKEDHAEVALLMNHIGKLEDHRRGDSFSRKTFCHYSYDPYQKFSLQCLSTE